MKIKLLIITMFCSVFSWGQATLPVNRTTWDIAGSTGWTDTPLDSYLSTFACSGSNGAKFDTTGDRKIIFFNAAPTDLTFVVKSNATTTSSLFVEESADGITYSSIVNLSNTAQLPTTCSTKGPYPLLITSRYVRWTFNKGSQNMTMDDVIITAATLPTPEIEIEGNTVIIADGNTATVLADNTYFGTTPVISGTITKTFTIKNTGPGILNLTNPTANVVIGGADAADFSLTLDATSPIVSGGSTTFQVTFDPSVVGLRNANISIDNNDSNENPYNFNIQGNGSACTPTANVTSITPTSGPVGTQVLINGTGFTGTTQVKIGSGIATYVVNSPTLITAIVPAGASTGNITVTDAGSCSFSFPTFTLITNVNTGCDGASTFSDLIISEVYDSNGLNVWHVELFNPTAAPINLGTSNYTLKRYGTVGDLAALVAPSRTVVLSGVVNAGATFYLQLGNSGVPCVGSYDFTALGAGINELDEIVLAKNGVNVDKVECPNEKGYSIKRNIASSGPTMIFNAPDWTILSNESCADLSLFPVTPSAPPLTSLPVISYSCNTNSATITVSGTEGVAGLKTLTYQWFVSAPGAVGWTALTNTGVYTGTTTPILSIATLTPQGTQYYCQIRENDATCFVACNATIISLVGVSTQWNGTAPWTNGPPTLTTAAIINGSYNTGINGSFDACNVTVNALKSLTISANTYVNIQNGLVVNGTVLVQNNGSLVQINDNAVNSGDITVERTATVNALDYVYWSAPVAGQSLATQFNTTPASLKWRWDADATNANGTQGNWLSHNASMTAGVGYIAGNTTAATFTKSFTGNIHNGLYTPQIKRGFTLGVRKDNWNLLGNPYPSAISVYKFLDANADLEGAVYVWKHGQAPTSTTNPFYQNFVSNYYSNDYLTANNTGNTASPADYKIASGQGFMVVMKDGAAITTKSATFNNGMRDKGFANNIFYRTTNVSNDTRHRIWLDLSSDTESSRTLFGYVTNATNDFDDRYDAITNTGNNLKLYTTINNNSLGIQGKSLPFLDSDIVSLGVNIPANGNYSIAISEVDGLFSNNAQTIYLEDKLLNVIHNLNTSPYSFSANSGNVNNRFLIRYTNTALNTNNFDAVANQVSIFGTDTSIKINSMSATIKNYVIYNVLGQTIASENDVNSNTSEIKTLQKSNQALIVKATLENGQVITRKIIF
jgi:hypothetical protein